MTDETQQEKPRTDETPEVTETADEPLEASEESSPTEEPTETTDEAQLAEEAENETDGQADTTTALATVEAILFATDTPLPVAKISRAAELGGRDVKKAIAALNERYESSASAFRIEEIAGGYQMLTLAEHHDTLARLFRAKGESKLSQAAMETLAIIAYRQPILRADVEAIRGVACGEVLRGLLDKQMVKIVGRAEVIGRPMLYGTTRRFLEVFGLANLEDLPKAEELKAPATPESPKSGEKKEETPESSDATEESEPAAEEDTPAEADTEQPETPAEETEQEEEPTA